MNTSTTTIQYSDDITELAPALHAAQSEMGPAILDSTNPAFRSKFASLSSVLNASVPVLNKHGISVQQHAGFNDETKLVQVTTVLMHKSGQRASSTCGLPLGGKRDGHAYKSATTYLRRIALIGICGLAEADDDGNATVAVSTPRTRRAPKQTKPVDKSDLKQYNDLLTEAGILPETLAAFMSVHQRDHKSKLTGEQLFSRLEWAKKNVELLNRWEQEQ